MEHNMSMWDIPDADDMTDGDKKLRWHTTTQNTEMPETEIKRLEEKHNRCNKESNEISFELATQDDCLEKMVPSDLRQIIAERDQLRKVLEKAIEWDGWDEEGIPALWLQEAQALLK